MPDTLEPTLIALGTFVLVALASKTIGSFFSKYGLPYITGYLLAGMLAGPFVFDLMQSADTERLRFIDELSLAVIAFIAGSELYLKELRSRLRPIMLNTAGVILIAPILLGVVLFVATDFIDFTSDFSTERRVAVAILGATILLALSPASTIAVIQEVRARGQFTKTILSMTVVMDVVIIVFFAISAAIAAAIIDGSGFSASFLGALVLDLIVALVAGIIVGNLLAASLSAAIPPWPKIGAILGIGLAVFVLAFEITDLTKEAGLELHLEPLLVSMIGGFYVTNFTNYRAQFEDLLHDVSPLVYVAFFTLTGVALKLDILIATGGIATILFVVRMFSIFLGSYAGGTLAGEPAKFKQNAWLGLVTQAGIALGLAREVAVEFPELGDAFATLIISVVVLNEIFGPLFLKSALRRVGETHEPSEGEPDAMMRNAVILGVESQSVALARQLTGQNWEVILADTDQSHVERLAAEDIDERHIAAINAETLNTLMSNNTDALVAMLPNDAENLAACQIACEAYGCKRIIVRLNDISLADQFKAFDALVVHPAAAMVNLLDQYVRAPQSAALLMHSDPTHDITQITVTNRDIHGMLVRDLRLPGDVLILDVQRNGHSLVPNGYTKIQRNDEITLLGSPQSLEEVTLRLGY